MQNLYRIKPYTFLFWWLVASIFIYPVASVISSIAMFPTVMVIEGLESTAWWSSNRFNIMHAAGGLLIIVVLGGAVGFSVSILQRWLLRNHLYWAAEGWRKASVLGGIAGAIALAVLGMAIYTVDFYNPAVADDLMLLLAMPVFIACVSAAQYVSLRHAVSQAWMWIFGNVIAGFVYGGLLYTQQANTMTYADNNTLLVLLLAVVAQGIITGHVILFLFEKKLLLSMTPEGLEDDANRPKSVWDEAI